MLAQLTEADVPPSPQAFSERLAEWFDWTNAISLAAALNDGADAAPTARSARVTVAAVAGEAARVRDDLARAIHADFAGERTKRSQRSAPAARADAKTDLADWRRRYVARQQSMDATVRAVRGRVRAALTAASPALARLAAVDEVMERVLGERERTLLSIVPAWLERRFERVAAARPPAPANAPDADDGEALDALRREMHDVLRAELDLRWQPVEGLLAALRTVQSKST